MTAQIILFCGAALSTAALGDCSFVTTRQVAFPDLFPPYEDPTVTNRRGVGFFFWELDNNEKCSWTLFDEDSNLLPNSFLEELWEYYFDEVQDSQWRLARNFAALACFLAWMIWLSLFCIMPCTSMFQPLRWVIALVLVLLLITFQSAAFVVFRSDLCDDDDDLGGCEFSRGAWFSYAACLCFAITALCFALMKDYPGIPPSPPSAPEPENEKTGETASPPEDEEPTKIDDEEEEIAQDEENAQEEEVQETDPNEDVDPEAESAVLSTVYLDEDLEASASPVDVTASADPRQSLSA